MSGEVEKLSGKLGIDTTDFKTALSAANRELRVLESGFKAGAAALGDWTQSATGLEARAKSLTSQIDIQKLKVEALRAEQQRLAQENGENSRAAQDAEIKLNKETEQLNKMELELQDTTTSLDEMKQGTDNAGESVNDMGDKAEESGRQLITLEGVMSAVGAAAEAIVAVIAAVGAAALAAAAGIADLVLKSTEAASEINDMSVKTGISTTKLQEYKYAAGQMGVSLDTITGSQAKLIRSMASASDGTGEQAKAFAALGIKVTDASGKLRDSNVIFEEAIDALGKVQNPAERDALAMTLFGKSAQELNPLIKAGASGMAQYASEAHKMGAVVSEETIAKFDQFGDTLDGLKSGLQGVGMTIAAAFLPGFQSLATQAQGYLQQLVQIVNGANGDIGKMMQGIGGLIGKVATDLARQAPQMLDAGMALLKSLLDAITQSLPTILPAGSAIIGSLVNFIAQNLPTLLTSGLDILLMLVNAIIKNLPMIVEAAVKAIVALVQGLTKAAPQLIPAIVEAVQLIANILIENLPLLVDAAMQLMLAIVDGIVAALPTLQKEGGEEMIKKLAEAIIQSLPIILEVGAQILIELAKGLISMIDPQILKVSTTFLQNLLVQAALWVIRAYQIGVEIVTSIADGLADIYQTGVNFVIGLGNGIESYASWIIDKVATLATNIGNGLASMATSAYNWGVSFVQQIWQGVDDNVDWLLGQVGGFAQDVIDACKNILFGGANFRANGFTSGLQQSLNAATQALQAQIQLTSAQTGGVSTVSAEHYAFYGPTYVSGQSARTIGKQMKGRRY